MKMTNRSTFFLSNSYADRDGYLVHYTEPIKAFLQNVPIILFVPFTVDKTEWDIYTQKARIFFNSIGIAVLGIHEVPRDRIFTDFEAIFIGEGNTELLLSELESQNLLTGIQHSVLTGKMLYLGIKLDVVVGTETGKYA